MDNVDIVPNISLYLFIPSLFPFRKQQQIFNEPIERSCTLSFYSWVTDRKPVNTVNEHQLDVKRASNIIVPLYIKAALQETQGDNPARPPNQFNKALFDNVGMKRYFVHVDSVWYPKDENETNCAVSKYFDQYRDLKLFTKEYNGLSVSNPFISYLAMKTFYSIQVIDPGFHFD